MRGSESSRRRGRSALLTGYGREISAKKRKKEKAGMCEDNRNKCAEDLPSAMLKNDVE